MQNNLFSNFVRGVINRVMIQGYILFTAIRKPVIKRTPKVINKAYDQKYESYDINKVDKNFSRLDMYRTNQNKIGYFVKDGKLFRGKFSKHYQEYEQQFMDSLSDYKSEHIVELGCGMGGNLFQLSRNGFTKLSGSDVSSNGINFARKYNKKFDHNVSFEVLDITKSMPDFSDKILMTITVLEQLKHSMKTIIQNIIDSNPKLVINFEVDYDNAPFTVKRYFQVRDYQNNFVSELKKHNDVEIISIRKLSFDLSPVNRLSEIKWKPKIK